MARHYGVTCDSCLAESFKGKRYKCLRCYDFDLCATCYEAGLTAGRHSTDHPVQCVLTRGDQALYFKGRDRPDSFTCPHCGRMGFALAALADHTSAEHQADGRHHEEILCPVCAANLVDGSNRLVTNLFVHLNVDHRYDYPPPEVVCGPTVPPASRRNASPHSTQSRPILPEPYPSLRSQRSQLHFGSTTIGPLAVLSANDANADPIADFISQLSTVRRAGGPSPLTSTSRPLTIPLNPTIKTPHTPRCCSSNVDVAAANLPKSQDVRAQRLLLSEKLAAPPGDSERRRAAQIRRDRAAAARLVILATILPDSNLT